MNAQTTNNKPRISSSDPNKLYGFFSFFFSICFPIKKTEKKQIWSLRRESQKVSSQKDPVNDDGIKDNPHILFTVAEYKNKISKQKAETLIPTNNSSNHH